MTRPSVGKGGTHGKFLVEVQHADGTRAIARRFLTEVEGQDFYDRTVNAHQQKANREQVAFTVSFIETASPKSRESVRNIAEAKVAPH